MDSKGARTAAERLRASVAAHPVAIEGTAIHTTVSVGIAMGEPTNDPSTLLQAADAALYRAKAEGRNRVVVSGEGGD